MPDIAPSPALLRFAQRQSRIAREVERRAEARHFLAEPVVVQPVDSELNPLGSPQAGVTRDISPSGIGLIVEERIEYDLAAISLNVDGEGVLLLVEFRWRRPMEPFEYVGGRVLRELDHLP